MLLIFASGLTAGQSRPVQFGSFYCLPKLKKRCGRQIGGGVRQLGDKRDGCIFFEQGKKGLRLFAKTQYPGKKSKSQFFFRRDGILCQMQQDMQKCPADSGGSQMPGFQDGAEFLR